MQNVGLSEGQMHACFGFLGFRFPVLFISSRTFVCSAVENEVIAAVIHGALTLSTDYWIIKAERESSGCSI